MSDPTPDTGPIHHTPRIGSGTLSQIGTITIDQSGTGRMQQRVEGVQVRNVVGQAIVLYSHGGSPQTTLPANLNGSAGATARQGVIDSPRGSRGASDAGSDSNAQPSRTVPSKTSAATGRIILAAVVSARFSDGTSPTRLPAASMPMSPSATATKLIQSVLAGPWRGFKEFKEKCGVAKAITTHVRTNAGIVRHNESHRPNALVKPVTTPMMQTITASCAPT